MRWKGTEDADKIVNDYADKWKINGRSKTATFSQFDMLYILAKQEESKK
jgi:hypothetical protein